MIEVGLGIEEQWLGWHGVTEVEFAPQARLLGGKPVDASSRAGKPGSNGCHGFVSVRSLRFLI
jgi:hypothetical protein